MRATKRNRLHAFTRRKPATKPKFRRKRNRHCRRKRKNEQKREIDRKEKGEVTIVPIERERASRGEKDRQKKREQ
jgi:hypothetical protein